MLQMTYFHAELVRLIVSLSDWELEVQSLKKWQLEEKYLESLTVDPIMLEDELWMRQCEKASPNHQSQFLKTKLRKLEFFLILRSVRFYLGFW